MKIIFSRKGFDSSAGGKPSIVVGDRIISFPIPQAHSGVFYKNLYTDLECTYDEIFRDLEITQYSEAHVDPDIYENIYGKDRPKGWRGSFGQDSAAQSHLHNEKVEIGDIFLFFGWYKKAKKGDNSKFEYEKYGNFNDGFHMLYGFLEIGEILNVEKDPLTDWQKKHTHVMNKTLHDKNNNYLYVAAKKSKHGLRSTFGVFNPGEYIDDLILSKKGNRTKSTWEFNENLIGCKISHHGKDVSISNPFETVGRGQEFVVDANKAAEEWVVGFINKHIK